MNEEKLKTLNKNELYKEAVKLYRQNQKLKKSDSMYGIFLRAVLGVPLIVLSRFVPNSTLTTKYGSADLLILAGVLVMFAPQIISIFKNFRSKK